MECRRCGAIAPEGTVSAVFDQPGWKEGLCPTCREERNARALAAAGRIAAGTAALIAEQKGWTNVRTATIRDLPSQAIRSVWTTGDGATDPDMAKVWAELGDGFYLMTVEGQGVRMSVVVDVAGDEVEVERIGEEEIPRIVELARELETRMEPAAAVLTPQRLPN